MALSYDDQVSLLKDWKSRGYTREQAQAGLTARLKNEAKGTQASDFWSGVASSVPQTIGGLSSSLKYINPSYYADKWLNGGQGLNTVKEATRNIQFGQDIRGDEALWGGIGGDIAADIGMTYAATQTLGAAAPGAASMFATQAPRWASRANSIKKAFPVATRTVSAFAKEAPSILTIDRAQSQAREQDPNTALGLGLAGALSLLGGAKAVRAGRKALSSVIPATSAKVSNIVPEVIGGALETSGSASGKRLVRLFNETKRDIAAETMARAKGVEKRTLLGRGADFVINKGRLLRQMGPEGKKLEERVTRSQTEAYDLKLKYGKPVNAAIKSKTQEWGEAAWNALDNEKAFLALDPRMQLEVKAIRSILDETREQGAVITGKAVSVAARQNYAPHILTEEMRERIVGSKYSDYMITEVMQHNQVDRGMAVAYLDEMKNHYTRVDSKAFFELSRSESFTPPSFFEQDLRKVLPAYLDTWSNRVAEAKWYGPSNEFLYKDLNAITNSRLVDLNQAARPGQAARIVEQLIAREPQEKWMQNVRAFNTLKMAFSAVSNVADLVPTAMRAGMITTTKNAVKMLTSAKARKTADELGAALDDLAKARTDLRGAHQATDVFLKAVGFTATQKFSDRVAVLSGLDFADATFAALKKNPNNIMLMQRAQRIVGEDMVGEFLENGMTEAVRRRVGTKTLMQTRPISFMNVPLVFDDPGLAGLTTQFRRYAVNLGNVFYDEIIDNAMKGDVSKAANALGAFVMFGAITGEMVGEGRQAMWNGLLGSANLLVNGEFVTGEQKRESSVEFIKEVAAGREEFTDIFSRIAENMGNAGGLGLWSEAFNVMQYGRYATGGTIGALMGPTAGLFGDVLDAVVVKTPESLDMVERGTKTPKQATNRIVSNFLRPIPHLKKAFDHVVSNPSSAKGGYKYSYSGATVKARIDEAVDAGHISEEQAVTDTMAAIKEADPEATDAGATATIVGSAASAAKQRELTLAGARASNLAEVIKKGNGAWYNVAEVIDGDTLRFEDGSRLRMLGVDAPEIGKAWNNTVDEAGAQDAKAFTSEAFPVGSKAYVDKDETAGDKDAFGRDLGYAYTEKGRDISKELVETGKAKAYDKYPAERAEEFKKVEQSSTKKKQALRELKMRYAALPGHSGTRTQCGEWVNDALRLTGVKRLGNSLASKMDSANFKKNGTPKDGDVFIEDTGTKYGHAGIVVKVLENGDLAIRDSNYKNTGKLESALIHKGSERYNSIVGYFTP